MKYSFLFDLARVLVFPKNKKYSGDLNPLYSKELKSGTINIEDLFVFNNEILNYLREVAGDYEIYMFTSGTMQNDPKIAFQLEGIFRNIFSAEQMGMNKKDFTSYIKIAREIKKEPSKIVFIDDNKDNIAAAKEAGFETILFKDNKNLTKDLKKFMNIK